MLIRLARDRMARFGVALLFLSAGAPAADTTHSPLIVGEIVGRIGAERGITIQMDAIPSDTAELYGL